MRIIVFLLFLFTTSFFVAAQPPAPSEPAITQVKVPELYTPDSSIKYAAADLAAIPAQVQPYIRYLSLYNIPRDRRREVAVTASFVINSLSKRQRIYIPVFVGGSDETVVRINLKDYDINPKIWDELGQKGSGPKPFPEPYFHAVADKIQVVTEEKVVKKTRKVATGRYVQGKNGLEPEYKTEEYDVVEKVAGNQVRKKVLQPAPWLDPASVTILETGTKSEFPILRADWFIVFSTVEPIYHLFLDFGESEATFDLAIFADDKLAEKARSQNKAVVVKSAVARNNRTLLRSPTHTGGYKWQSRDTLKSTDDRNYVQNFLHEQFDAKEIIATLPNGLQGYLVTDGKGKRVDKADNEVATDYMSTDKIVRNGRSCIYCHSPGILPIQDEIRTLNKKLLNREQLMLLVASEEDAYKVEDLFGANLDKQIVRDQQIYADAVGLATGLSPQKNATNYLNQWEGYVEHLMIKEDIAYDLGITVFDLERFCRLSGDPLFLGLIKEPIRPVRRDQFEQSFQTFMLIIIRGKAGEGAGSAPVIILDPKK